MNKSHFVCHRIAVGCDNQSIKSISDQVVESGDSSIKLSHSTIKGSQLSIEVGIGGEKRGEVVLNGLKQVDPTVPESNKSSSVVLYLVVSISISISNLNIPHRKITKRPNR